MVENGVFIEREKFIEGYIPLVKYIASRVIIGKSKYVEYEDLVGYGMLGLMDAFNKFDESKGMKFSTYASIRIRGAMIDEIRKNSPVSKTIMDKLNKFNNGIEELQRKLLREPTTEEICNKLNIKYEEVSEIERYINCISVVSLDEVIFSEDDDIKIIGIIEDQNSPCPEKELEDKEEVEILHKAIELLNEKDKTVLSLYYYEGLTLKQIGLVLEVSESRVCQLHSRAIRNLRANMKKLKYI